VAGGADDLPVGVTEADEIVVVEGLVDGVRGNGLVEILGQAASRVAALDGVGVGGAGGDSRAPALEDVVAADVVGVPVGVDHEVDVADLGTGPGGGVVGMADEAAVDHRGFSAFDEEQVGVGKGSLVPGDPLRQVVGAEGHRRRRADGADRLFITMRHRRL
jgi:hypothetical protein